MKGSPEEFRKLEMHPRGGAGACGIQERQKDLVVVAGKSHQWPLRDFAARLLKICRANRLRARRLRGKRSSLVPVMAKPREPSACFPAAGAVGRFTTFCNGRIVLDEIKVGGGYWP